MTSNADRLAAKVQKLKDDIEDETERGLAIGMGRLLGAMKHRLVVNGSVATGTLLRGLEVQPATAEHPEAYAAYELTGPDYWRYLEFGTGRYTSRGYKAPSPHAPVLSIFQWIVSKGIVPDPTGPADTPWELAHMVASDTSTGTRQHKFARPAWRGPHGRDAIADEVGDGVDRALAKF